MHSVVHQILNARVLCLISKGCAQQRVSHNIRGSSQEVALTKSLEVRPLGSAPSLEKDLTVALQDTLVCSRNLWFGGKEGQC